MNVVDYIGRDDSLGGVFTDSMKEFNLIFKKEILEIYRGFEGLHTLHPAIKGINYDLPSVVEKSPSHPGIEHIARDMFVRIPKGDAIFMKWILHGWDDDRCLMILKNCYEALPDNGKVIVVDMVIQEAPGTSFSAKSLFLFDVYLMNTNVMGKERTERELQSLAKAAGFSDIRVACSAFTFSVVELLKNM
ncbi:hypothetical protein ACFX2G_015374 [Malus domestica]